MRISIIGAGIGGLTLAKCLLQTEKFSQVKVFERSPILSTGLGSGFAITNGMLVLERLGYQKRLKDIIHPFGIHEHYRHDGTPIGSSVDSFSFMKKYSPYVAKRDYLWCGVKRGDLMNVLAEGLPDNVLQFDKNLQSYRLVKRSQKSTSDTIITQFSDGTEVESDILVGCDGLNSTVRQLMLGKHVPPKYSGYGMWYGTSKLDKNGQVYRKCEGKMIRIYGPGNYFGMYPCGGDKGEILFFNAHHMDEPLTRSEKGRTSSHGDTTKFNASFEDFVLDNSKNQLLEQLNNWADPVPHIIEHSTRLMHFPMYYREPLLDEKSWYNGPVTLLGDAAHPTLPFMGQGANQAIEDAYLLSKLLSDCSSNNNIDQVLTEYYNRRQPKTSKLVQMAVHKGKSLITTSPLTAFTRDLNLRLSSSPLLLNMMPSSLLKMYTRTIDELLKDVSRQEPNE